MSASVVKELSILVGVARDMFSAFFEEAYKVHFDGASLLAPVVHPTVNMQHLPLLGAVISHAYLSCEILPTRIAFPCLVSILLGSSVKTTDEHLLEAFSDSLSNHDASVIRDSLACESDVTFSLEIQAQLLTILACYGCREVPRPSTLKQLLIQIARYEFTIRPQPVALAMNSGVPEIHRPFWLSITSQRLHSIYTALSVTPSKVFGMIDDPNVLNPNEDRSWNCLRRYIGSMTCDELRTFLRFVTGSCVIRADKVNIIFNALDGLARRPVSHTCSYTLEVPSTYRTYLEFVSRVSVYSL